MQSFVIVSHSFQMQLCKVKPVPVGIFPSLEAAEPIQKQLHLAAWRQIIKEGIRNDTFTYHAEDLKSRGFYFGQDASEQAIMDLVSFIETGEVDNPYTMGKSNLKPLRIVEVEAVPAVIRNPDTPQRWLIKEDELFWAGENTWNIPNNPHGNPVFVTDEPAIAQAKMEALEHQAFIKRVLDSGHTRRSLQAGSYYKQTIGASEGQLDEIEARLVKKGIDWNAPKGTHEVMEIKETVLEVVGVGLIDHFYSINTFL